MSNSSPILVIMGTEAGKEFTIPVASPEPKVRYDGSCSAIEDIGAQFTREVLQGRDFQHYMRCQAARSHGAGGVRPARIGRWHRFNQYLNRLEGLGQLDRIVIDDCHTVLQSRPGFRRKMREAGVVSKERGKQMVLLTAMLAPAREAEFLIH